MVSQFAAAALLMIGLIALAISANCNTEAWQRPLDALESWDPTLDNPCLWGYVTCDRENYLIPLDLENVGISGSLIPELGDLKKLQCLNLFSNSLNGQIPITLRNLSNLVGLDLHDNQFSGTIPGSLGAISTLKIMRLDGNNLMGAIPSSLGSLANLVDLELQNNALSGSIPASLGNISKLQHLRLNGNMLTGTVPREILSLISAGTLSELNIENNNVTWIPISTGLRGPNSNVKLSFWLIIASMLLS